MTQRRSKAWNHLMVVGLILATSLFQIRCEKNDSLPTPTTPPIQVGLPHSLMRIEKYDSPMVIQTSYGYEKMGVDVNWDGKNDICFNVGYMFYLYGSEGGRSAVANLHNNVEIAIIEWTDTVFTCTEVDQGVTYIYTYTDPNYHECSTQAMTEYTPTIYPGMYREGINLVGEYTWGKGEFVLTGYSSSFYGQYGYDSTISKNVINSGIWETGDDKYLLFRIKAENAVRHGWLRISPSSNSLLLYEIACQKD